MFSVLQHHPANSLRLENKDPLPAAIPRDFDTRQTLKLETAAREYASVDPLGRDFHKYRARPLAVTVSGAEEQKRTTYAMLKLAPKPAKSDAAAAHAEPEARTRTVMVQTDYRCIYCHVLCRNLRDGVQGERHADGPVDAGVCGAPGIRPRGPHACQPGIR